MMRLIVVFFFGGCCFVFFCNHCRVFDTTIAELSAKLNQNIDTLMESVVREHMKKKRRREKELAALGLRILFCIYSPRGN